MINKKRKILNLISEIRNSHPKMVGIYTQGSCMNFHMILRCVFPEAKPYYNSDHIITKIDNSFYDITGVVLKIKGYMPYEEMYCKKQSSRSYSQMYNYVNNSF